MIPLRLFSPSGDSNERVPTVRDLVIPFLDSLKLLVDARDYSEEGYLNVRRDLLDGGISGKPVSFVQLFGDCPYHDVSQQSITKWLLSNPQWQSLDKKKGAVTALIRCLTWAENEDEGGLIDRSPIRRKPRILRQKAPSRRLARPDEYIALMWSGCRPLKRGLYFLWNSGARPKEMRELRWPDILFDEEVIDTTNNKTLKATGETRVIGLEPRLLRFLRNLYRQRPSHTDLVFLNARKTAWTRHTFARQLRRTAKAIGIDEGVEKRVSAYQLRHTYITEADEADVHERRIGMQTGHKGNRMIEHYSKARRNRRNARRVAKEIAAKRRKLRKNPEDFETGA